MAIGKEIDDDGDVVDHKGVTVGHCSLLEDIPDEAPPEEPQESAEDKEKREQAEQDKKMAIQMASCIEQCLDNIRPICKLITEVCVSDVISPIICTANIVAENRQGRAHP